MIPIKKFRSVVLLLCVALWLSMPDYRAQDYSNQDYIDMEGVWTQHKDAADFMELQEGRKDSYTFEEIKNAYNTAAQKHHPDKFQDEGKQKEATKKCKKSTNYTPC